jgi:uncharacterized protein
MLLKRLLKFHLISFFSSTLIISNIACTSVFYFPTNELKIFPSDLGIQYEEKVIYSDGLKLYGWYLPASIKKQGTVLFLHGNAQNIANHLQSVAWMPEQGLEVYLFDYRGYGLSEGRPSPAGIHTDTLEMINAAHEENQNCIILFGQSLGATVALYAASYNNVQEKLCAVIADSPFAEYRGIVREKLQTTWLTYPFSYPLSFLVSNKFSPLYRVSNISPVPVLFIHGKSDKTISSTNSEQLFYYAKEPKDLWLVSKVDHIQVLSIPIYRMKLLEYLTSSNSL